MRYKLFSNRSQRGCEITREVNIVISTVLFSVEQNKRFQSGIPKLNSNGILNTFISLLLFFNYFRGNFDDLIGIFKCRICFPFPEGLYYKKWKGFPAGVNPRRTPTPTATTSTATAL